MILDFTLKTSLSPSEEAKKDGTSISLGALKSEALQTGGR
jgi:hypothetical protein